MESDRSEPPNGITFAVANMSDGPKSEQEIGFVDEEAPPVCLCSKLGHCLMCVGRRCSCRPQPCYCSMLCFRTCWTCSAAGYLLGLRQYAWLWLAC